MPCLLGIPRKHGLLDQCWAVVVEGGPALARHWVDVSCCWVTIMASLEPHWYKLSKTRQNWSTNIRFLRHFLNFWNYYRRCIYFSYIFREGDVAQWLERLTASQVMHASRFRTPLFPWGVGGGPMVVVSTAAFHARVRGSFPGYGGLKETKKCFFPIHVCKSVLWGASVTER